MFLKAKGRFSVDKNTLKVVLDRDFCRYYKWLYDQYYFNTIKTQIPMHGAHIGIVNPKIHKDVDTTKFLYLNKQEICFEYNIEGYFGGYTKGFKNFWLDVRSKELENIALSLKVLKTYKNFSHFHITILNNKNLQ